LKKHGRLPRPISSTSAKPAVVISAVFTPLRSVSALMTTVVPWANEPSAGRSTSPLARTSRMPCSKFGGVVLVFAMRMI
jgi:hypothetical protein